MESDSPGSDIDAPSRTARLIPSLWSQPVAGTVQIKLSFCCCSMHCLKFCFFLLWQIQNFPSMDRSMICFLLTHSPDRK